MVKKILCSEFNDSKSKILVLEYFILKVDLRLELEFIFIKKIYIHKYKNGRDDYSNPKT